MTPHRADRVMVLCGLRAGLVLIIGRLFCYTLIGVLR